jgi:hypothetical protein
MIFTACMIVLLVIAAVMFAHLALGARPVSPDLLLVSLGCAVLAIIIAAL